jgi:hypothetical protein
MDSKKVDKPYWHEQKVGNQTQKWNWRSEYVNRLGLDSSHRRIWISFGIISIIGFTSFVYVKAQVIESRRKQMKEREQARKELEQTVPSQLI